MEISLFQMVNFMIRLILLATFLFLFLVLSTPLMLIEWIIGKFNTDLKDSSSLKIVNWAFRVCRMITGAKVEYIGEENIPTDTPVLYVGNHRSYFDIVLTYVRVPRVTGYIAKKELGKVPLLNIWMKNLHCQFLDRENVKEGMKTILTAIDMMNNGKSVCIFPEGTRGKVEGEFLPFHEGSFKIATKAGCPIVPMTINNSAAIFEDQLPKVKKAHVIIEYGKPIYPNELPKEYQKQIGSYVQNIIAETHKKNAQKINCK